ncbi:MAG: STAS domain-containing protein [Desulfobacterales bacterium]|nr:STAS domain-containing protein [Desulfobacterales bacterium]
MNDRSFFSGINMQIVNNTIVIPVNGDMDDDYAMLLQKKILEKVKATSVRGVLIDMSDVKTLDTFTFSLLVDTARMISMLGTRVVFVGFQPGVVSALVDLDVDFKDISTAVTMEDGFELLQSNRTIIPFYDASDLMTSSSITEKNNEQ